MQKLIEGYRNFRQAVLPDKSQIYRRLAGGQYPDFLFITCCDSRVQPLDFTGTDIGDLFVERCLGNIVPDPKTPDPQIDSILEYSLLALKVKHVVICGHSGCGAMRGLLEPETLAGMPAVASWLENAKETLEVVRRKYPDLTGDELLDATVHENVRVMLDRLRRTPVLTEKLASGEVTVHGWVFEIENGRVVTFDPNTETFVDLADWFAPQTS